MGMYASDQISNPYKAIVSPYRTSSSGIGLHSSSLPSCQPNCCPPKISVCHPKELEDNLPSSELYSYMTSYYDSSSLSILLLARLGMNTNVRFYVRQDPIQRLLSIR